MISGIASDLDRAKNSGEIITIYTKKWIFTGIVINMDDTFLEMSFRKDDSDRILTMRIDAIIGIDRMEGR